jgi:hypothetical protein
MIHGSPSDKHKVVAAEVIPNVEATRNGQEQPADVPKPVHQETVANANAASGGRRPPGIAAPDHAAIWPKTASKIMPAATAVDTSGRAIGIRPLNINAGYIAEPVGWRHLCVMALSGNTACESSSLVI